MKKIAQWKWLWCYFSHFLLLWPWCQCLWGSSGDRYRPKIVSQMLLVYYNLLNSQKYKSKGKLICGLKNNIRNFVNFHASSWKSEKLHFDRILLYKAYKDLDENVQKSYVSWHGKVMQSLKKNWLVVSNTTWGIWWIFTQPLKSLKISLRWAILSKVYEIWAKKMQRSYLSWHWTVM